ncbi:cystathionine beta-lyase [Serratia odorifera]|uniref:Cystathionine beta-lyase n=2 Tax=Serratia odorifera TaxID=618 RepID=D4E0X8_SEROD|nr:cystathionine beta-lyase [Serratia odorifera]EFE96581.1 cystathionine beta-lyase [Serratia odorifera DSM 4582]MBJ2066852.1 cystathionine beta-lyase [Serratia odorifera]PNK90940.1 cystathionine beta-lyase [Serratia odorifera]RII72239.1 cystathionine beta-lyase [Serratia odorifera]VDZ57500.1 Cystathionine beta-lyase metC [Serratia odorifera]
MKSQSELQKFKLSTQLSMLGRDPEQQSGFVNAPVYRGSTVVYKSCDDIRHKRARFSYGTSGTPTIENLENAWSTLCDAAGTVISPSGLGALALALFSVTRAGDHILVTDSVYRPTRKFCNTLLVKYGVSVTYYDPLIGGDIERLLQNNTRAILLECPGSQSFEIQDIGAIVAVAKKYAISTIIDNTWATPIFFKAHAHGIDLSVEAGTKYLGGHSDLLMGLVSATASHWPALRETYDAMAMLPGAEDCFLALRGLRTLHLRVQEAQSRGLEMARWLKRQPEVSKVLHPAFEECPGHENWKKYFTGSTGLFSIVLDRRFDQQNVEQMLDNMHVFAMGFSWGGFESLIIPFDCAEYRTATTWDPQGMTLRIQIGLEDIDDLKNDLRQGLMRLHH